MRQIASWVIGLVGGNYICMTCMSCEADTDQHQPMQYDVSKGIPIPCADLEGLEHWIRTVCSHSSYDGI